MYLLVMYTHSVFDSDVSALVLCTLAMCMCSFTESALTGTRV